MSDFDKVDYWIELAIYDLDTAKAMLTTRRYLYVGFMCNQAIEKMLKAYYVFKNKKIPPYTHNMRRLATEANLYKEMNEKQKDFIDDMIPFNIEGRYPEYKQMLYNTLKHSECEKLITETEEFMQWTKNKLEN